MLKNLHPNLIVLSDGVRKLILVELWYFPLLTPHDLVTMPWWGFKCAEMYLDTELFRIPVQFIVHIF